MPADFPSRLRAFAGVIVRVGLNLQRGQRLLIAEPYDLQGVARSAEVIVDAVRVAATAAGCPAVEVLWGDGARLREYALNQDWRGFGQLTDDNARRMQDYLGNHDALLFLQGSQPNLLEGIPAAAVAKLRRIGWENFGPIAQQLMQGETNWTVAPAPSPGWAHAVYGDLPTEQRLAALWDVVFEALRIPVEGRSPADGGPSGEWPSSIQAWRSHLIALQEYRDDLNARRLKSVHYQGNGTDLTLSLPPEHLWCSAQLVTKSGVSFVANLPTEEVFTLPHRDSAEGKVRVSRPINYGGARIEGIEIIFERGVAVHASATAHEALLHQLLDTDAGAGRLGEVALVLRETTLARARRLFHHPLLDENASNHIALGDAYGFCLRLPDPGAINHSLIHVDLPLDARVTLSKLEPP